MEKRNLVYLVLIASLILLVINLYLIGLENIFSLKILSPLSNLLIIIAMLLTIREINKNKTNID